MLAWIFMCYTDSTLCLTWS